MVTSKAGDERSPVVYTLGDALKIADKPLPWVVEGLLLAGTMNLITAEPKAGKSTLVRTLCDSIATGKDFLGRPVTRGLCIYFTLEDMLSAVAKSFKQMGTPVDAPIWLVDRMPHDFMSSLEWLYSLVMEHQPVLVVIDTFIRFTGIDNINDYSKVVACLEPFFQMLYEAPRTCLVFCHHDRKPREHGGGGPDRIMGSYGLFGEATSLLNIRRNWRTNARTIQSWQRVGVDLDQHKLLLNTKTGRVELGQSHAVRRHEDLKDTMTVVIERIRELGPNEWHSSSSIAETSSDSRRVYEALSEMSETGMLQRRGRGVNRDPYEYALPDVPNKRKGKSNAKVATKTKTKTKTKAEAGTKATDGTKGRSRKGLWKPKRTSVGTDDGRWDA